jgi:hypothetical protein
MIVPYPNESRFEAMTVERLEQLGYEHDDGRAFQVLRKIDCGKAVIR